MIIIFTLFIIFIIIIFYNILIWLREKELKRSILYSGDDDEDIDENKDKNGIIREGMKGKKDPLKEMGNFFKKIPNEMKNISKKAQKETQKGMNVVKKSAQKGVNEIKKGTLKGFNEAKKLSQKGFNEVKKGAEKGLKAINNITKVIEKEIAKPINMIKDVITMITCYFNGIGEIFVAIGSYIMCGVSKIVTLPSCFLYYFLDILYYIFIALPIWFLTLIFPPLKGIVKNVYNSMMQIDKFCYNSTGFHIFKYQESVLNRCYRCQGLKGIPNLKEMCSKKKNVEVKTKTSCDILAENKKDDSNSDSTFFSSSNKNTESTASTTSTTSANNGLNTETISERDVEKRGI